MKSIRFSVIMLLLIGVLWGVSGQSQDQNQSSRRAEALAATAREQFESERYRLLRSQLDELLEAQSALQRKVNSLSRDLSQRMDDELRDFQRRQSRFVTRDEFEALKKTVEELDRKRRADHETVLSELKSLRKAISRAVDDVVKAAGTPAPPPTSNLDMYEDLVYDHEVQRGETVSDIMKAYNEQTMLPEGRRRIGLRDVQAVNPGLNLNVIRIGQIIKIPIPRK